MPFYKTRSLPALWSVLGQTDYSLVWFKRDLRLSDHLPLCNAAGEAPAVGLYFFEPSLWSAPDADARHWDFVRQCLLELETDFAQRGSQLLVLQAEAAQILPIWYNAAPWKGLHAHEETGNNLSYQRDRKIRRWVREHNIPFTEYPNNGVVRRLASRDHWSREWNRRMAGAPLPVPALKPFPQALPQGLPLPTSQELKLSSIAPLTHAPLRGGHHRAVQLLESFLQGRGKPYSKGMSSPNTAWHSCSRLSPFLAWGAISIHQIVSRTRRAREEYQNCPQNQRPLPLGALKSFLGRCHWHCHFIQKLESQPEIEWQDLHSGFAGLREDGPNDEVLERYLHGQTGYPFIDACMRYLRQTGWINFRMRAMLVSFAAYHLWIDWRCLRDPLARMFRDYEPGIHFSQLQMQRGVTGINTLRIYNPVKQGLDHDPEAAFIARWVPELSGLPKDLRHAPWKAGPLEKGLFSGHHHAEYPEPVVDLKTAIGEARRKFSEVRKKENFRTVAQKVYQKHGSRKSPRHR